MLNKSEVEYPLNNALTAKGYISRLDELKRYKGTIMIAPDWGGRSEFYCEIADRLGKLGYVGFAIDMYGNAKVVVNREEKERMLAPLKQDRNELQRRILAAFHYLSSQTYVDAVQVAAIGYCFGGRCVLDLARVNEDVKGVVSIHGILDKPPTQQLSQIKSKILVLHGYEDTFVKPDQLLQFTDEMTEKKADWQLHIYGNTHHAFTKPNQDDPVLGLKYSALADRRSWGAMLSFFNELFAPV